MAFQYKAPLRDMQFVMHDVLGLENLYASLPKFSDTNRELIDSIVEAGAQFCEGELAPINRSGDEEGCHFDNGVVTTPKGFKEAYAKYVELGFASLAAEETHGGQGLPPTIGIAMSEMMGTANWSFGMYPGLSHGAINTVEAHGTPEQKEVYLTKLISGEWHAGSDLGLIRTKAEPNADGSYDISGTKIFISAGEHDLSGNIVHIVLARLPDAPKGTKGISLFIVPKFMPDGVRNTVACGSIEHKMGIKASATCVMNFDNAKGFLIGPPNRGLNCMFTFMNVARIGTAVQGLAAAEGSFQGSLAYARDRLAMRALTGPATPEKEADPIIVHPAVRQMLLTQKAFAEGGRLLCYWLSTQTDFLNGSDDEDAKKQADELMSFLTPIAKAFLTETGYEAANHGVQIYGGHGFVREWGMEQIVRDTRIAMLYEGTTQIQALDLLGRKVLQTQGAMLRNFTKIVHKFCEANKDNADMLQFTEPLAVVNQEWADLTMKIGMKAMQNPNEAGAAAVDYMMFSGYATLAYLWAWMAQVAQSKIAAGEGDTAFYEAKVKTAQFYFQKLLPRTKSHAAVIENGGDVLMQMDAEAFAF
jgi:hypothetical protein